MTCNEKPGLRVGILFNLEAKWPPKNVFQGTLKTDCGGNNGPISNPKLSKECSKTHCASNN